jgi:osmoprotectant transport system permease protein
VIIAGLRVATVISVGTATIAAAIGAGGLGVYIFRGLRGGGSNNTLILAGAIPAAILALGADFALGWVERSLAPGATATTRRVGKWALAASGLVIASAMLFAFGSGLASKGARHIVVGSKDFTESRILAELVAQAIESKTDIEVERQFELGGDLCHRALLSGQLDAYVEYTGTAFTAILGHEPLTDPREVYNRTRSEYETKFNLEWLEPLGFNNTFAILVRGEDARRLNLKTISDAARYASQWRAGFGQDFVSRQDGYPGFVRAYGLKFREAPREMDLSLTYQALADHQVDLIAGNSTDGLIERLDLYQLEDDRHYFPPYEAAPVFRKETLDRYPEITDALKSLAGKLTDGQMRKLNYAVDGDHRDVKEGVREFLNSSP